MAKTIMIVDDEPDIRNTTRTLLEINGFKVILAVNADDALNKLKSQRPDLILLDIMMPGTTVREFIHKVTDIKIAFFSVVKTTSAEKEKLMQAPNIVGYIQKPYDVDNLVKKIKAWI